MNKKNLLILLFFPYFFWAQECEKVVVNTVLYDCFYDGDWDISEDNLAMIEYIKSRSTGETRIEYTTKDYLDEVFYKFSKNYNVDWGKYATAFSLKNFKIFINGKKYKYPFTYEQIFELGDFKTLTSIRRKRTKIYLTTK